MSRGKRRRRRRRGGGDRVKNVFTICWMRVNLRSLAAQFCTVISFRYIIFFCSLSSFIVDVVVVVVVVGFVVNVASFV